MRLIDKRVTVSRRGLLASGGAGLVAMSVLPGGLIAGADGAWAATAKALKAETFATLVQMGRDLYPHDLVADKYYAIAIGGLDEQAKEDSDFRILLEDGVAGLDGAAQKAQGRGYKDVGWESDRVAILIEMEQSPFFQTVRGHMITGLYNQKEIWPIFGYEGESASQGGYLHHGFDDIDWLDKA